MRKTIPSALAAVLALGCGAATADVTGSVAFTTDYVFRGISQTDENPAVQGALNYNHESGVYAGIWGSNVDFNDGSDASMELDAYLGYAGSMDALGYDVGAIYYAYPGADADYDYWELKGTVSYSFENAALAPKLSGSIFYSPDFFLETGTAVYYTAGLTLNLPEAFALNMSVGYQDLDDDQNAVDDYTDWKVGVSKELAGLLFDLSYTDTNDDGEDFAGDWAEGRGILTVSKSF